MLRNGTFPWLSSRIKKFSKSDFEIASLKLNTISYLFHFITVSSLRFCFKLLFQLYVFIFPRVWFLLSLKDSLLNFNIQSYILNDWIKTIIDSNCLNVFFISAPSKQVASVEHWHSITRFSIIQGTAHSQLNLISDVFTPFLWAWFLKTTTTTIIIIVCICTYVCKLHLIWHFIKGQPTE